MLNTSLKRTVATLAGLLLVGLFALVYNSYQRDIQQARKRISAGSQIAETPCGPIEYAAAGSGLPILIVHGAGGGFDQGIETSRALVESGFRVIAVSRFGYLRTPLPADASAMAQADAYACLLDALNIRRAAVIGASAGAPSSMQFALRHPERTSALVLLVPAAFVPRAGNEPPMYTPPGLIFLFNTALKWDFLFWVMPQLAHDAVLSAIFATPADVIKHASADERMRIERLLEHILPVSPRRLGLLNDATIVSTLPRYELERINTPTLILSMADDLYGTYDGARYSANYMPRARFLGYPSGGHLWIGHQQEVMSEIAAFLNSPIK